MDLITQNEDIKITITLRDENAVIINPSAILFLMATIHQSVTGSAADSIIETFSKSDMQNTTATTFQLFFKREKTQNLVAGNALLTITADLTGAGFTDGKQRSVRANLVIAEVVTNVDRIIV